MCMAAIAVEIGLGGPLLVGPCFEDVLISNRRKASRPLRLPTLYLGTAALPSSEAASGQTLHKLFDAMWLGFAFDDGSPSFSAEAWEGDTASKLYAPQTIGGGTWL